MANQVVAGASVEITMDLSKFATDARTQLTEALSSSSMRDAVTAGLDSAAANAGTAGQSAASKFASGISESGSTLSEAGAKAGQAVTDGLTTGVDGAASVLGEAGARGGEEFVSGVNASVEGSTEDLAAQASEAGDAATVAFGAAGADAGDAYAEAVQTTIDAGATDVAESASDAADVAGDAANTALGAAGEDAGDSFIEASKTRVGELAATLSPVTTAEAAKVGTEAGGKFAVAGAAAGEKFTEGAMESVKGLAASLGPVIGVLGAGELVKSSIEAGDQLEGANIKIENVFGESGEAVKEWASGVATSLRESSLAAETQAGAFGGYLAGLGVGKEQAADMSEQLVSLTANMAAFSNADPAAVQSALTSALKGRTTALKQYGVTLTDAQVQQEAMTHASELGLTVTNGTIPALNTQQKALATLYAVMDVTKTQQGALASTSDTLKAKEQVATAEFANMRAELGTRLMPILASVFGFINADVIPGLEATGSWVKSNSAWLGPLVLVLGGAAVAFKAVKLAQDAGSAAAKLYATVTEGLGNLFGTQAAKQRASALASKAYTTALAEGKTETEAAAAAQVELDGAMDANPIGLIVAAIAALAIGFYEAYEHSATFRNIIQDIGDVFTWLYKNALLPVWSFIETYWPELLLVFAPFIGIPLMIYKYWGDISGFFVGIWNDISGAFMTGIHAVEDAWTTTLHAIETAWDDTWNAVMEAWDTVGKPIFDGIEDVITYWEDIAKIVFLSIVIGWQYIWDAFDISWRTVGKPVLDAGVAAFDEFESLATGAFNLARAGWKLLWSDAQLAWNTVGKPILNGVLVAANFLWLGVTTLFGYVQDSWRLTWTAMQLIWSVTGAPMIQGVEDGFTLAQQAVAEVLSLMESGWNDLWAGVGLIWTKVGLPIINAMQSGAADVGSGLSWAYNNVIKPIGDAIGAVWNNIGSGWSAMINGLSTAGSSVVAPIKAVFNGVIDVINGVIGGLNKISVTVPSWSPVDGGKTFGINIAKIPNLADGATIRARAGGTLVNVAEAGRDETVVDAGDMNKLIGNINARMDNGTADKLSGAAQRPVQITNNTYQLPGQDPSSLAAAISQRTARAITTS